MRRAITVSLAGFLAYAAPGLDLNFKGAPCSLAQSAPPHAPLSDVACVAGFAGPYPCSNVDLMAHVSLQAMQCETGNSLWGWTDPLDGREYALMGCDNGISFVDITEATAPVYLGRLPTFEHEHLGAATPKHEGDSLWRDVRVYANHAFVVSEQPEHHMQVFDLTRLRSVASPPVQFVEDALYEGIASTHTIAINEGTGFAFLAGTDTCSGGLHMVDISDPLNPVFAGCVGQDGYVHEAQCTTYNGPDADYAGHEMCFNSNTDSLTIADVTDKDNPIQVSRTTYAGSGYTHQGWLTEDHRYFLLNDELDECNGSHNSYTYIWDLVDLDAPVLMGHYTGPTAAIDHNLYVRGGYAYESNYRAGLRILDVTGVSVASLTEVAFFDIYPEGNEPVFNGNWNNYPFFESGNVILSGIEQGLFIVHPNLDPDPTSLVVADASVTEGDAGSVLLSFSVSLTRAVPDTVTVSYASVLGNATPGVDYTAVSGVLTFDPEQTSRTVDVTVFGDVLNESDETFQLALSAATNARIADSAGVGRILNDDPMPALAITDVSVSEGDGPGATASFTVSLSTVSGQVVSATLATADGTATASDYTPTNTVVSLSAGQTQKVVNVAVTGDERDETDEFFLVNLTAPNHATLDDAQATATILDDDTLGLASITPAWGPSGGGAALELSGESFEAGATVAIGEGAATGVVVGAPDTLTATAPALAPGSVNDVVVTIPNQTTATLTAAYLADFLDVDGTHPFHDFVATTALSGITAGCGSGNYCPSNTVTRAQMAVFLLKGKFGALHVPPAASGTVFTDVPQGSFAADWIEELASLEITGGCGGGNYCPNGPVTRAQMAVFLLKALLGSTYTPPDPTGIFGDVPPGSFADEWIEDLYVRGVTGGCSAAPLLYCPNGPNTRGQMAVFLVRTFSL